MEKDKADILSSIKFALLVGLIPCIVFSIEFVLNVDFSYFGILARHTSGLKGIIFSPMVHGSLNHLFSNLPPLMFSVFLIHFFYSRQFWPIFLLNYLLTGIMVWLFSREVYHIGASGVVYALISFIFWAGLFVRNITSIILSLLVLVVYSGMFAGIVPSPEILEKNISWESHLLGALVGITVAWMFRKTILADHKSKQTPLIYPKDEIRSDYFHPETFDKTKWQRYLDEQSKFEQ